MEKKETIFVNNKKYTITIYLERRKNAYLSIGKKIVIRIPTLLKKDKQDLQIAKFKEKIIKYLQKYPNYNLKKENYLNNHIFKILDQTYVLKLNDTENKTATGRLVSNDIVLNIPFKLSRTQKQKMISSLVNKLLSQKYLPFIKERVGYYNDLYFQKDLKKISLKKANSKLGSCTIDKKLMFSTTLLLFPEDVRDYVIVHELAHTIEHNHSKRFWAIVEKIIPDYKEKKKWIRKNSIGLEI
ncbi:MAG: M48 family metallopeptidase [archaeon]|jgi:hypothetical protein|nr:M48 family metallopeptidase [archaeon]MDD2477959.1 M48 family metallopeptidase [Candidatus ainarchaeum sp.]MDD3084953.1 M48 family metallopeptidase [Candidatus ainarchaeum sp.]MDD4221411.1 M48 family metallopeptidase [Candidatus ainarchaeum sp.]MDD4662949.1 M48 family metallopeptidase [Candidatus ainarchaeum sp.]